MTWEIATLLSSAAALLLATSRLPTQRSRRTALVLGALAVVAAAVGLLLR